MVTDDAEDMAMPKKTLVPVGARDALLRLANQRRQADSEVSAFLSGLMAGMGLVGNYSVDMETFECILQPGPDQAAGG